MLLRKLSTFLLFTAWIALLVAQMIYFVPCKKMYLVLSDDNVSHATVVGNGYASIFEIEESFKAQEGNGRHASCKTIDTPQLAINVTLTTILTGAIYFLFIFKKVNNSNKQKITKLPVLNFDELAFADEETKEQLQKEYAEAMYHYIKSRIDQE